MTKLPDHMAGMNSLPRWDPSNPTAYRYDAANYNAADYAKFKEARQAFGQQQMKATAERNKQIFKDVNKTIKDKFNEEKKKLTSGQKQLTRGEIKSAVKAGKKIYADRASECFYSLSWRADPDGDGTDGTAHAVFNHRDPGDGYDYDIDLDTFLDWASDSLGQFFNAEIRD
jgi:hypothetical protein